jgi:hypothetical protein
MRNSILLFLVFTTGAAGSDAPLSLSESDGVIYEITITDFDSEKYPAYNPESSEIVPLPVNKAIEIAKKYFLESNPKLAKAEVLKIALDPFLKRFWVYCITFSGSDENGKLLNVPVWSVYVTLDGKVVPPKIMKKEP